MAFFEDLTKKAKNVAAVAADKAKDAAEITKLSVAIAGEQREIDKNYRAIGEWYVNEYEGEIPDGVRDLVEAVATSKAKIAELEAAEAAAKENGPAAVVVEEKVCPICGAKAESKFCPQCGAPMGE
jgi:rubrerythrin